MNWIGHFDTQVDFKNTDEHYPNVIVGLAGNDISLRFEAVVDTGAALTLFNSEDLEAFGWIQAKKGEPGYATIGTTSGARWEATGINLQFEVIGLDESFDMMVYGSHKLINRNFIGRDWLAKVALGLHIPKAKMYFASLISKDPNDIFVDVSGA